MTDGEQTGGEHSATADQSGGRLGGHGGGGVVAIEKIANDIYANLKKQLGDHPKLDKAAVVKAVSDKIATLAGTVPPAGT